MCATTTELAQHYALKGICNLNDEWMLSIKDVRSGHHEWLQAGQSFGSLRLLSYDSESESAQLSYQDKTFSLRLAQNSHEPLSVVRSSTSPNDVLDLINKKAEAYRVDLHKQLIAGDPRVRSHEALRKLEKKLETSVANYKQRLLAEYDRDPNNTDVLTDVQAANSGPRITGGRLRNRVNSRIWASDHIDKHGLPAQ